MASAGSISIKLSANDAEFKAALGNAITALREHERQATRSGAALRTAFAAGLTGVRSFASGAVQSLTSVKAALVAVVAGASVYKLVDSLKSAANQVEKIGKSANILGVSSEFMSGLAYAAESANIPLETLSGALGKGLKSLADFARTGKGPASEALRRLKIDVKDLNGEMKSLETLLPEIARAISFQSKGDQLSFATAIFGRNGGTAFLQTLDETGDFFKNLPRLMQEARKLGVLFTPEQVKILTTFNDSLDRLRFGMRGIAVAVATEVAPVVTKFLDATAFRLGDIANAIPAAARALKDLAFGGDDASKREALDAFKNATVDLLLTTGVELGKVVGVAIVEAFRVAFTAIAPDLADIARDVFGPILNVLPGVNIEGSTGSKLAGARGKLATIRADMARLDEAQQNLDQNPYLDGMARAREETYVNSLRVETSKRYGGRTVADLEAEVAALEAQIARARKIRGEAVVAGLEEGARALTEQIASSTAKITGAGSNLEAAKDGLLSLYEAATPPPATASAFQSFVDSVRARGRDLVASVRDTAADLRKAAPAMLEKFGELGLTSRDLRARRLLASPNVDEQEAGKRLEVETKYLREAAALRKQFGPAAGPLLADLTKTKDAELSKLFTKQQKNDTLSGFEAMRKGWSDAVDAMTAKSQQWRELTTSVVIGIGEEFSGRLADDLVSAEISFRNFGSAIGKILGDVGKMAAKAVLQFAIFGLVARGMGFVGDQFGFGGTPSTVYGPPAPNASGNAFERGRIVPHAAGGVFHNTAYAAMANGNAAQIAEAGPEGVLPLARIGGKLGVHASGGGVTVQIVDQRGSGARPTVEKSTGPDGAKLIRITIRDEVTRGLNSGEYDGAMASNFGARRRGVMG